MKRLYNKMNDVILMALVLFMSWDMKATAIKILDWTLDTVITLLAGFMLIGGLMTMNVYCIFLGVIYCGIVGFYIYSRVYNYKHKKQLKKVNEELENIVK